ncbi:isochorismatase family protein [Mycetocola tolaasinivorans]|uniref:Isochorismatase family protein n=1 Tax=Mycetocola tolaasinivorans TaxID=76635 RepID=A0A3L7ADJ2_9MICO|nr:isochorismatase family protein [Mycetocola tolaasinivorans]RLP77870.1 isochorismatase family protein [Mycetocola tolaasinivorans]
MTSNSALRTPALIVIDVQRGFGDAEFWGPRNNLDCEDNIAALIARWRERRWPVVFVQHDSDSPESPLHPDNPGHAFADAVTGTPDLLVRKRVNSSFHGAPDLHAWLAEEGLSEVVICGIATNLHGEFATVLSTREVLERTRVMFDGGLPIKNPPKLTTL